MLIWIRRILVGLAVTILVLVLGLVGVVLWDANFGNTASDYANAEFTAEDGSTVVGYLARPETDGNYPGVLMVHEWWGLNGEITELADEMAEEGYVVFAPDTYRGATTDLIPRALYLRINVPMERVERDMQAAYDYLVSLDGVDAENVGVVGFCYGGGVALEHGINNPDIDATINLYGSTPTDANGFGALATDNGSPLLGIFGAEDQMIPLDEVRAFEAALTEAGVDHRISIYDDVGHAFVQPDVIDDAGSPREAWEEILAFFDANLKGETTTVASAN